MRKYRFYRSYPTYKKNHVRVPSIPANSGNTDDGYDAARDAYNMGYGEPVTRRQREEDEMLRDEYRRNGW